MAGGSRLRRSMQCEIGRVLQSFTSGLPLKATPRKSMNGESQTSRAPHAQEQFALIRMILSPRDFRSKLRKELARLGHGES